MKARMGSRIKHPRYLQRPRSFQFLEVPTMPTQRDIGHIQQASPPFPASRPTLRTLGPNGGFNDDVFTGEGTSD